MAVACDVNRAGACSCPIPVVRNPIGIGSAGEGFRMPAVGSYSRTLRGPVPESLSGRNPPAAGLAVDDYGDLTVRRGPQTKTRLFPVDVANEFAGPLRPLIPILLQIGYTVNDNVSVWANGPDERSKEAQ